MWEGCARFHTLLTRSERLFVDHRVGKTLRCFTSILETNGDFSPLLSLASTWTMKHPEGQTLEDRGLILED